MTPSKALLRIADFNQTLNLTPDEDQRFNQWYDHRQAIKSMTKAYLKTTTSVLIIGAGALNDVPLNSLIEQFDKVTLLDIDHQAMVNGLKRHGIPKDQVDLVTFDLTGLDEKDFMERFKEACGRKALEVFLDQEGLEIRCPDLPKATAVIVMPLYTQILFHQMVVLLRRLGLNTPQCVESCMYFCAKVLDVLNDGLIKAVLPGGDLLVFSDVLEYASHSLEANHLMEKRDQEATLTAYVQKFQQENGFTLGGFGIENLCAKSKGARVKTILWPFDENRLMVLQAAYMRL